MNHNFIFSQNEFLKSIQCYHVIRIPPKVIFQSVPLKAGLKHFSRKNAAPEKNILPIVDPKTNQHVNLTSKKNDNSFSKEQLFEEWIQVGQIKCYLKAVMVMGCENRNVFKGEYNNREVAVMRTPKNMSTAVCEEIVVLQKLDPHLNVIQCLRSESDHIFHYSVYEFCKYSFEEYVKKPEVQQELANMSIVEAFRQATEGVLHLHENNIIHNDINPNNILLSISSQQQITVKICNLRSATKLGNDSLSSRKIETEGWHAPEQNLQRPFAVDVFQLGCVFFYGLSKGKHPFGDQPERQSNIRNGIYSFFNFSETDCLSVWLIEKMITKNGISNLRAVLSYPMFWGHKKQLIFLTEISDRLENVPSDDYVVEELSQCDYRVPHWFDKLDLILQDDIKIYCNSPSKSMRGLLRALRNTKYHFQTLDAEKKKLFGNTPNGFIDYWTQKFPELLPSVYDAMQCCATDDFLETYYP